MTAMRPSPQSRLYRFRVPLLLAASTVLSLLVPPDARSAQFSPERYGIGAVLVQPEDSTFVEVRGCTDNGPAARAGLQSGDRLLEIDGQSVRGWAFKAIVDLLIADKPLPVRITIERGSTTLSFEMVRMRFSDIAAGAGFAMEAVDSTGNYRAVPLRKVPQLNVGDVVPLDSLVNTACKPESVSLGERWTIVYFWASWCGPCKVLFSKLRGVSTDVPLISIDLDRTCDDFKAAVAAHDPPGADFWADGWYGRLPQALAIYRLGIPTAVLLDSERRLVRVATGVEPIMEMITTDRGRAPGK
jgi:thiol-disulfide isomerase/thioredoxin